MPTNEVLVRKTFQRVSADQLTPFRSIPTGFVVDAQNRGGALEERIKSVTSRFTFVGNALTVRCRPWDNLAAHVALEFAQENDVLMITTGGFEQASVIGEKYIGMARNKGVVAVVTDGMARDVSSYDSVGIPVFCRGIIANSSFKNGPGEVGLPISIGGVAVDAGDVVVGDRDGVVVVPRRFLAEVAGRIAGIVQKEEAMFEAISKGGAKPDAMASISKEATIRYVE